MLEPTDAPDHPLASPEAGPPVPRGRLLRGRRARLGAAPARPVSLCLPGGAGAVAYPGRAPAHLARPPRRAGVVNLRGLPMRGRWARVLGWLESRLALREAA